MIAVILSGLMLLPLTACGSASQTGSDAASSVEPEIVLDVAFENNSSEPIGAGWERAQEIIKEKSGGKMAIEVYPDSQLGDKSSLIDSMLLGEPVYHTFRVVYTPLEVPAGCLKCNCFFIIRVWNILISD